MNKLGKYLIMWMLLAICMTGCGNQTGFRYLSYSKLPDGLTESAKAIYTESGESINIQIASCDKCISPLKMVSIQNLYNLHNLNLSELVEENNTFRFSVEKSIYENKDYVLINELSDESYEEDYFEAYYAATYIKNNSLKEKIDAKYSEFTGDEKQDIRENIYQYLNHYFQTGERGTDEADIQKEVYRILAEESIDKYTNIYIDDLLDTKAAVAYMFFCGNNTKQKELKKIYQKYQQDCNQKRYVLDMDFCLEDYTQVLYFLMGLLNVNEKNDWLFTCAQNTEILYQPVIYDYLSPQNFASYMMLLSYTNTKLTMEQYETLQSIYEQILEKTDLTSYKGLYYLKLAAELLNIDGPQLEPHTVEKDYFYYLYTGERGSFDIMYDAKDGTMDILDAIECSETSSDKVKILDDISIFDYEQAEDFAVLLNQYVLCKLDNGCLSKNEKKEIRDYIYDQRCELGFRSYNGGYDFRTSVYYANILYILDGGEDVGLR